MPFAHEAVNHGAGEYVRGEAHTNGVESFWSMLKRGYQGGTYHKMSPKHLDRYVAEFAGRHNVRDLDTAAQMSELARGMVGKRLRYRDLVADNGLESGARPGKWGRRRPSRPALSQGTAPETVSLSPSFLKLIFLDGTCSFDVLIPAPLVNLENGFASSA